MSVVSVVPSMMLDLLQSCTCTANLQPLQASLQLVPVEIHLALSVSLQERVLEETFNQFSPLKINKVLFTKLDEGLNFGPLINLALHTQLPLSYFTNGQRVPEDIETASKDKVIRLIFNLNQDKVGV